MENSEKKTSKHSVEDMVEENEIKIDSFPINIGYKSFLVSMMPIQITYPPKIQQVTANNAVTDTHTYTSTSPIGSTVGRYIGYRVFGLFFIACMVATLVMELCSVLELVDLINLLTKLPIGTYILPKIRSVKKINKN